MGTILHHVGQDRMGTILSHVGQNNVGTILPHAGQNHMGSTLPHGEQYTLSHVGQELMKTILPYIHNIIFISRCILNTTYYRIFIVRPINLIMTLYSYQFGSLFSSLYSELHQFYYWLSIKIKLHFKFK